MWVRQTDAVEITSIAEEPVTTRAGRAPTLPATVVVTYNDGSKDGRISVTWDPVEPGQYAEPGTFAVKGDRGGHHVPRDGHRHRDGPSMTGPPQHSMTAR
ncbi:Ig-like domain-containing protein [Streptomyces sp. NPDC057474]|uniref:Ig-like domain-containing protein n=1 Tax=Streptomyces sp. NPDC057474 TaxID=3346144 RepID=UPI0036B9B7F8